MPRKKHDNGGDTEGGGGGGAGTENAVVGKYRDVFEQIREARGEKEGEELKERAKEISETTTGNTEEAAQARDEADPERKARDVIVKAAQELWKEFPETNPYGTAKPAEPVEGTLYSGCLTLHSVDGGTLEPISRRVEVAGAMGEDGVFHVFQSYFPAALREKFEIDAENKTDPEQG